MHGGVGGAQDGQRVCLGERLRFVLSREPGAIDEALPGRELQAAAAADEQQPADAGPWQDVEQHAGRVGYRLELARTAALNRGDHGVVAGDDLLDRVTVEDIGARHGSAIEILEAGGVPGDGGDVVPSEQRFSGLGRCGRRLR